MPVIPTKLALILSVNVDIFELKIEIFRAEAIKPIYNSY